MSTFYGIDLGTTYSCIATYDGKTVQTIRPSGAALGSTILPSVVYFDPDTGVPTVGDSAKSGLKSRKHAPQTLTLFKRQMGQDFCTQKIMENGVERFVSPVEGSACIIRSLLLSANESQRSKGLPEVNKAVITVPAGFNSLQLDCTKLAAELAGVEVLGLVREPMAAAISYDIKNGETILVFDLGGGTLDVSIVHKDGDTYTTLASAGDMGVLGHHVGGQDWDEALINFALGELNIERNRNNLTREGHLHIEAERCKIQLSSMNTAPFTYGLDSVIIRKADFERITRDLVDECMAVVERALELCPRKVDRCVLAGGSSNMPMIRSAISRLLGGRIGGGTQENNWFPLGDPEEAIARGAAKFAFLSEKGKAHFYEKPTHSYGTQEGVSPNLHIRNLILSTDPMVFSGKYTFYPQHARQSSIVVDIYENDSTESLIAYDPVQHRNILNKEYKFTSRKEVTCQTEVVFAISRDKDGIISITVSSKAGPKETHTVSTIVPPVSEAVRQRIQQTIRLMTPVQAV